MTEADHQLSIEDISPEFIEALTWESYEKKPQIDGIKREKVKCHLAEDGSFSELVRLTKDGLLELEEILPFRLRQINYSEAIKGTTKAWHLHFEQDEIWYIAQGRLIVGLMDLREDSPTKGLVMRLILSANQPELLYIPRGVAHGLANRSEETVKMFYLVNNQYDGSDEGRLPPGTVVGQDFWEIQKG